MKAFVDGQPVLDRDMFVRGIVIKAEMDLQALGALRTNGFGESQELLLPAAGAMTLEEALDEARGMPELAPSSRLFTPRRASEGNGRAAGENSVAGASASE